MKRYGGLFEQVVAFGNLERAARRAFRGKRENPSALAFFYNLENELIGLQDLLSVGTYEPSPYSTFWVRDPKLRRICAAPFRDRVVHHAVCNVIGPIIDRSLISDSYACRPGKGTHAAISRAQWFARKYPFYLQLDIRKYFQSVDHAILKALLLRKLKDRRLLDLLFDIIDAPYPGRSPGKGIPIGNLTSQHFANLYLSPLDHCVRQNLKPGGYLRYMDDLLLFGESKCRLNGYHSELTAFLGHRLALDVKSDGTLNAPVAQGIGFLGVRVFPGLIRLDRRGWIRFTRKYRRAVRDCEEDKISEEEFLRSANGLLGHARSANTRELRRSFFWGARP